MDSLFHDWKVRQQACQSKRYSSRLCRMIEEYAVHHAGVHFSCMPNGILPWLVSKPSRFTTFEAIQEIYGADVATIRLLLSCPSLGLTASGWFSDTQCYGEQTVFLLVINDRLVESSAIKRGIKNVYAKFLTKGHHPFIYLSLKIDPCRIDVNIHPNKLEVCLLNQEETIAEICAEINNQLVAS